MRASFKGKIIVTSAGNENVNTQFSAPALLAPGQPREQIPEFLKYPIINVAGIESSQLNLLEERFNETKWADSNYGNKISVCAAAEFKSGVLTRDYTSVLGDGTSLSAPLVSGLAAEMILLDEVLVQLGERNSEMSANEIIRIIEATADDLGDPGHDKYYGHGRINVWKALLAVANGGTNITNPNWYGFEIRGASQTSDNNITGILEERNKSARIYIDNTLLSDADNTTVPDASISLYKRVPPTGVTDFENIIPIPNFREKTFLSTFSITRDELVGNDNQLKRLQLRPKGKSNRSTPFFEISLEMDLLTKGVYDFVDYDDYVFTIETPRVTELVSFQNGKKLTITGNLERQSFQFPIGTAGNEIELGISYPGFTPLENNTDIYFSPTGDTLIAKPEDITDGDDIITSRIKTTIPEDAQTGRVVFVHKNTNNEHVVSFSSPINLIIPRIVGVKAESGNKGDLIHIAINVPHFIADKENTLIYFSASSEILTPEEVTTDPLPYITNILSVRLPADMQKGEVTVMITVDNGEKVAFKSYFEATELIYTDCYIRLQTIATWDYSSYEVGFEHFGTAKGSFWGNTFFGQIDKQDDFLKMNTAGFIEVILDKDRKNVEKVSMTDTTFYSGLRTSEFDFTGVNIPYNWEEPSLFEFTVNGEEVCQHITNLNQISALHTDDPSSLVSYRCGSTSEILVYFFKE
jgi:hypothetical protein